MMRWVLLAGLMLAVSVTCVYGKPLFLRGGAAAAGAGCLALNGGGLLLLNGGGCLALNP